MRKFQQFILLSLLSCGIFQSSAQVGIGTASPNSSAKLEVNSTTQGFLPPRMTTAQRNAIGNPATGLVIYNSTTNSLQWFNGVFWVEVAVTSNSNPTTLTGSEIFVSNGTASFSTNSTCATKTISISPCSSIQGATLNDDPSTSLGIEYDWSSATSTTLGTGFGAPSNTRALVEINRQCWAKFNLNITPPVSGNSVCAGDCNTAGRLYNWTAAMNNSTTERSQGLCPTGWHIPSDCEWMLLEHGLGMSVNDQIGGGIRSTGSVGSKLSTLTSSATNASGFTALLPGFANSSTNLTTLSNVNSWGVFWSSSYNPSVLNSAIVRYPTSTSVGIGRSDYTRDDGFSVRCLKD